MKTHRIIGVVSVFVLAAMSLATAAVALMNRYQVASILQQAGRPVAGLHKDTRAVQTIDLTSVRTTKETRLSATLQPPGYSSSQNPAPVGDGETKEEV